MEIVFLLYPGVTQLDFTGPAQFLARVEGARLTFAAKTRDPIMTDAGFAVLPTATLGEVARADILCVPGGQGCTDVIEDDATLGWVRCIGEGAHWVTSVCTGSLILAAAGLLDGYRAGCHWNWAHTLRLFGAEPSDERVVVDRNRVTGGGVTAGIDFGLTLLAQIDGEEKARMVQLGLEYDPAPPFECGSPAKAGAERVARFRAAGADAAVVREARIRAVAERVKAQRAPA